METHLAVSASSHAMLATLEWELPLQLVVVTNKMDLIGVMQYQFAYRVSSRNLSGRNNLNPNAYNCLYNGKEHYVA